MESLELDVVHSLIVYYAFILVRFQLILLNEILFVQAGLGLPSLSIHHFVSESLFMSRRWPSKVRILLSALMNQSLYIL